MNAIDRLVLSMVVVSTLGQVSLTVGGMLTSMVAVKSFALAIATV